MVETVNFGALKYTKKSKLLPKFFFQKIDLELFISYRMVLIIVFYDAYKENYRSLKNHYAFHSW